MKGGQALSTCAACYRLKMSCKTSTGAATGRKEVEEPKVIGAVEEEVGVSEQESTTGQEKTMGRAHRPPKSAVVWAQACLEKYHKLYAPCWRPH